MLEGQFSETLSQVSVIECLPNMPEALGLVSLVSTLLRKPNNQRLNDAGRLSDKLLIVQSG